MNFKLFSLILLVFTVNIVSAGPLCYAGCAAVACACFTPAGFTFGIIPGAQIAAVPALASCNTAFGVCEAACVAMLVAPTF